MTLGRLAGPIRGASSSRALIAVGHRLRAPFLKFARRGAARATESHETANQLPDLPATLGPDPTLQPAGPTPRRFPSPRIGVYSWTRFESRVAFGGTNVDADGITESRRKDMSGRAT